MFWKQRIFEKRAENARHCLSPAGSRARGGPPPTDLSGSAACFCSQRRDGNPACILAQHP